MSLKKLNTSPGATSFRSQGTKPILPRRLAGEKCIAVEEGAITEVLRLRGGRRSPVRESAERRTTSSKCACGRRTARPRLARRPAPTPRQSFPGGAGRSCVYLTLGCLPAPSRSREMSAGRQEDFSADFADAAKVEGSEADESAAAVADSAAFIEDSAETARARHGPPGNSRPLLTPLASTPVIPHHYYSPSRGVGVRRSARLCN
jgi:hypothetical protein